MATSAYFEETVTDAATDKTAHVEIGTTNFAGHGPQMYIRVGDSNTILSHDDAKAFCEAVGQVEAFLNYSK